MAIKIKSYSLDSLGYIPLYTPISSNDVEVINTTSVLCTLRSDPSDATTELNVYPGESKVFRSTKNHPVFDPGAVLIYAILASGTGTVKVLAH